MCECMYAMVIYKSVYERAIKEWATLTPLYYLYYIIHILIPVYARLSHVSLFLQQLVGGRGATLSTFNFKTGYAVFSPTGVTIATMIAHTRGATNVILPLGLLDSVEKWYVNMCECV